MGLEIIVGMTVHQAIRNRRSVRAYPASSGFIREIMVNDRKPETEIFSLNGFGSR